MTDDELAIALNCDVALVRRMPPAQRARYERLAMVADEIKLWEAGIAPLPAGVIVCRPRGHRR